MRILVTGSEGLVGKELVKKLKKNNFEVISFDYVKGQNILEKKDLEKYLKKIDIVIHLAGIIDEENEYLWKINVEGTQKLLEQSIQSRVKKFIFLSSTGIYGSNGNIIDENTEATPQTIYDKSKFEAEQIILNRQEEIHINIIRSTMVFGPNKNWKKMVGLLKRNFPLPCDGKNIFQIIYVENLVGAIIKIMEKGNPSEIYLVSQKEKISLNDFCEKIKKELGLEERVWHIPEFIAFFLGKLLKIKILNKNFIKHLKKQRNYDIKKINSLGYKQKYSIDTAIQKTLKKI